MYNVPLLGRRYVAKKVGKEGKGEEKRRKMSRGIRVPRLLPSPKKIAKRGLYEIMWGAKPRDYGKRVKKGKY